MTTLEPTTVATARVGALQTLGLLAIGLIPWPASWALVSETVANARSPELNRAEREVSAAGYYEGLIGGGDGPQGARGELALRLMGKPSGWVRFQDADVSRPLSDDFLQFELKPEIRRNLFGKPFETNSYGLPGSELTLEKPAETLRIATLGSSMDMGWGVSNRETYASRFERWLNNHTSRRGLDSTRKFQVLNFAVAAYSPLQRLDTYLRKARPFRPDVVLYSATMLDLRLMEIHICDLLRARVDLKYDFLRKIVEDAKVTPDDLAVGPDGKLTNKERLKAKLQPHYWSIYDATIQRLADECRADGATLAFVIIPRVGKADAPEARMESVARLKAIAAHSGLTVYDLSDTYDRFDPATLEIAAWDDHPNALGHQRLFLSLARSIAKDREMYGLLFPSQLTTRDVRANDASRNDLSPPDLATRSITDSLPRSGGLPDRR
jgi:hypothetical protein